jgi:hypothetical protein
MQVKLDHQIEHIVGHPHHEPSKDNFEIHFIPCHLPFFFVTYEILIVVNDNQFQLKNL